MAACMSRVGHGFLINHYLCSNARSLVATVLHRKFHCGCQLQQADDKTNDNLGLQETPKAKRISVAMNAYMDRAKAYDSMMTSEIAEYEIGKRHLANIMGLEPDSITEKEVKESIKYLLPSGLTEEMAHPTLKHPYQVFPKEKAAQFDYNGRPFHFLFYTGKPNFYKILYDASWVLENLKDLQLKTYKSGTKSKEPIQALNLHGTDWISRSDLASITVETLSDHDYARFVRVMERVAAHPFADKEKDFIMKYRKTLGTASFSSKLKTPQTGAVGRQFVTMKGKRKSARSEVTLRTKGTGKVNINGQDLQYFRLNLNREQIMFPLQFVNKLGEVDIEAKVSHSGPTSQAGAIRIALSKALACFVEDEMVEKMRLAGLLTTDPRKRERKKPGQWKARKKFTWKKR